MAAGGAGPSTGSAPPLRLLDNLAVDREIEPLALGVGIDAQPDHDLVVDRVTNGAGVMPSFQGTLSEQQIQDVAAYVVQATSGG